MSRVQRFELRFRLNGTPARALTVIAVSLVQPARVDERVGDVPVVRVEKFPAYPESLGETPQGHVLIVKALLYKSHQYEKLGVLEMVLAVRQFVYPLH